MTCYYTLKLTVAVTKCMRLPQNLTSQHSVTKVGEAHRVSLGIYMQIVVDEKETF